MCCACARLRSTPGGGAASSVGSMFAFIGWLFAIPLILVAVVVYVLAKIL